MAEAAEQAEATPPAPQANSSAECLRGLLTNVLTLGPTFVAGWLTGTLPLAGVSVAVNWLVWLVHAFPQSSEKFFDATGTLTYVTLTISAFFLSPSAFNWNVRQIVLPIMVLVWSIRLGSYLLQRILRDGKDGRFDNLKHQWLMWLGIWSFQALWCFLVALPVLVILSKEEACNFGFEIAGGVTVLDIIGWAVWAFAFGFEVVADRQKDAWRQDPANKGKFITVGLWAYSRHPNYFGEILMWVGICICGASCFVNLEWASLVSPITTFVLLNYISGVPLLEKTAKERWGDDPAWQWYTEHTPCVIPALIRPPPYMPKAEDLGAQLTSDRGA